MYGLRVQTTSYYQKMLVSCSEASVALNPSDFEFTSVIQTGLKESQITVVFDYYTQGLDGNTMLV